MAVIVSHGTDTNLLKNPLKVINVLRHLHENIVDLKIFLWLYMSSLIH